MGVIFQNWPLMLAWRSDLGPGRRSRVLSRSGNTNPREKNFGRCWDIRYSRKSWDRPSLWCKEETLIRNRPLACAAARERFWPWSSFKGVEAVRKHVEASGVAEISVIQDKVVNAEHEKIQHQNWWSNLCDIATSYYDILKLILVHGSMWFFNDVKHLILPFSLFAESQPSL